MYINPFLAGVLSVIFIEVMFLIIFAAQSIRFVVKEDRNASEIREVYKQSEDDNDKDIE